MKRIVALLFLICTILYSKEVLPQTNVSQTTQSYTVKDRESKQSIGYANIYFKDTQLGTITNHEGSFSITFDTTSNKAIRVSCVGYENQDTVLTHDCIDRTIWLDKSSFGLKEVSVIAKENRGLTSSSKIDQMAMQYVQPSSFTDVLQLLPGNSTIDSDLSQMNQISLRQAGSDNNTSLGTLFVVDGATQSNKASYQSGNTGLATDNMSRDRITQNRGIDMRQIATDQIESVEVIRGIPSVEYGDVSSGAVIIKEKYGLTPYQIRVKADPYNKLVSASKGIDLGKHRGSFNGNIDYIKFKQDPRTDMQSYSRLTSSLRYKNVFHIHDKLFIFSAKGSILATLDKAKDDQEEFYGKNDSYKADYKQLVFSSTGTYHINNKWLNNFTYTLSTSYTSDQIDRVKLVSTKGPSPSMSSKEEGVHDETYLPSEYESSLHVDGKPFHLMAKGIFTKNLKTGSLMQNIRIGLDYNLDKNLGNGEQYDLTRPPYPNSNSRPRDLKEEIPSLQSTSLFAEDLFSAKIDHHIIYLQQGIRGTTSHGMSKEYKMQGKVYWDPRTNIRWRLPKFQIVNQDAYLEFHAGVGKQSTFPTLQQIYPQEEYFDMIQLNYYSQNPDLRRLEVKLAIEDPTNYNIEPMHSWKYEGGINFRIGGSQIDVTGFVERINNGFSTIGNYSTYSYRDYNEESVDPSTLSTPPSSDLFQYQDKKIFQNYSKTINAASTIKKGVEYQIQLEKIKVIYTSITINGAWYKTHYDDGPIRYYQPQMVIGDDLYPFVGIYTYDDGIDSEQLNTNIRLDTHIPQIKMLFTTSIESTWFSQRTNHYNNGLPEAYMDLDGNIHPYTAEDVNDPILNYLAEPHNAYYFTPDRVPFGMNINLKATKEIGKYLNLAFYANRILDFHPDYIDHMNMSQTRVSHPSFGAELSVKL